MEMKYLMKKSTYNLFFPLSIVQSKNDFIHTHTQVAVALVSPLILYKVLALATGEKVKAELDFAILASVLALVYKLVFK